MKVMRTFTILMLFISGALHAQVESTFTQYSFETLDISLSWSYSSEYFDGKVWFFVSGEDEIYYHPMTVSDEGKLENMDHHTSFCPAGFPFTIIKVNTVVVNQRLYLFYYNIDDPYPGGAFWYARIFEDQSHHLMKDENLNMSPEHKLKMTAAAIRDTVFLFYTEKHTGYIKYFKGVPEEDHDEIQWLSNDPVTLTDSTGAPLHTIGNVAACTYFTPDNKERIMLLYPSAKFNDYQNYLVFYSGDENNFSFHHQIESHPNSSLDWSARNVALQQGSVKGGGAGKYMMQAAYTTKGESISEDIHVEMFRHEFDLTAGWAGGLEQIPVHGEADFSMAPDFMEFYIPDGNTQEIRKYLYTVYNFRFDNYAQVNQWSSDILKYIGHDQEFAPPHLKEKLWQPICVVEGPPPFALNDWTIYDLWKLNKYPPSSFIYGQETTHTVGSNTIYQKTIEASGGFGPVTGGFKRAMQHNNNNSTTDVTKLSVVTTIKPPIDSIESEGLMVYFYDGPSLKRSQWRLHDYNGDTLSVDHSLFLFNFTDPQINIEAKSFRDFSRSPRLSDIYSYVERNVDNFPGLTSITEAELVEYIKDGISETWSFEFDTLYSNTTKKTTSVDVGIDAKYKIFHLQVGYTATLEYTTENNTENLHGFDMTYKNPAPKVWEDSNNVTQYKAIAYLMQTIDSSAYFFPGGFTSYKPLFITWEVDDIGTGPFDSTSYINNDLYKKFEFIYFPNPAANRCCFTYTLPEQSEVQLILYNSIGQQNDLYINEFQLPGRHQEFISVTELPGGLYFFKMRIGQDVLHGKLMVSH